MALFDPPGTTTQKTIAPTETDPDAFSPFGQLLEYRFRDVSFPTESFSVDLEQDQVQHKWPDRDGAHVEATGRAPIVFTARCLFLNGIALRGPQEYWKTPLYPVAFREFLTAMADRTTGDLQHPELGTIKAKPKSVRVPWDGHRRDGVIVEATWIESTETPGELTDILASPSPTSQAIQAAADVDFYLITVNVPIPPGPTFTDAVNSIKAAFDTASLISRKLGGLIDSTLYRLNTLADSITAAKDATTWPAQQAVQRLLEALWALRKRQLVAVRDIAFYIVPNYPTTIATIAAITKNNVGDIVALNPLLAGSPTVAPKTVVRYYAAA